LGRHGTTNPEAQAGNLYARLSRDAQPFCTVFSRQRYLPATPVSLSRGRVSTNRTFDPSTGANTTTSPNPLATQLFGDGSITISPVDRWTLELQIAENPWFTTVSPSDIAEFDGSELDDAVIELEYLVLEKS